MRKRFFIVLFILCVTMCPSYCDTAVKNSPQDVSQTITPKKESFFSRLFQKHKQNKNKDEVEQKGYYGTLPNIERNFEYKKDHSSKTNEVDAIIPEDLPKQKEFKSLPLDDKLLLDNILKKEKTSNYINDIQRTRHSLESLKKCIEEDGSIQRFNGCVNVLDLYVQNLYKKYSKTSDSMRNSYIDIIDTTYSAKVVGNLLYDANYYARYIPTSEGKYSTENIKIEKRNLLNKINKTLFIISQED